MKERCSPLTWPPTALDDLVLADFEIATVGNFIIGQVLITFDDIGDAGITEASLL